jgi:uncharacterized iron-regulated membrane protein
VSEQFSPPAVTPVEKPQGNAFTRWFKGQSTIGKIRIIVVLLLVVVGGPIAYFAAQSAPSAANVNDCMKGQTADAMKKVACTDPTAEWTVVGRLSDKTEAEFDVDKSCAAYPTTEVGYWEGKKGQKGFILCLAPKK